MKDAKGHGSNPRGGPTSPKAERKFLNRQLDSRKVLPPAQRPWGPARPEHTTPLMMKLQQQFGGRTPSPEQLRGIVAQQTLRTGQHTSGIHQATSGGGGGGGGGGEGDRGGGGRSGGSGHRKKQGLSLARASALGPQRNLSSAGATQVKIPGRPS